MPLTVTPVRRVFSYNGLELPDPNPGLSADAVREFHAQAYPELATAKTLTETSPDGTTQKTTFTRSVGTKG